jgi:hypothetical protein
MELLPKKIEIVPIAPQPTIIPTAEPEFEASDEFEFMILIIIKT